MLLLLMFFLLIMTMIFSCWHSVIYWREANCFAKALKVIQLFTCCTAYTQTLIANSPQPTTENSLLQVSVQFYFIAFFCCCCSFLGPFALNTDEYVVYYICIYMWVCRKVCVSLLLLLCSIAESTLPLSQEIPSESKKRTNKNSTKLSKLRNKKKQSEEK